MFTSQVKVFINKFIDSFNSCSYKKQRFLFSTSYPLKKITSINRIKRYFHFLDILWRCAFTHEKKVFTRNWAHTQSKISYWIVQRRLKFIICPGNQIHLWFLLILRLFLLRLNFNNSSTKQHSLIEVLSKHRIISARQSVQFLSLWGFALVRERGPYTHKNTFPKIDRIVPDETLGIFVSGSCSFEIISQHLLKTWR